MSALKIILHEARTRYLQAFAARRVPLKLERGIVSLTFDDVPRTALTNAVPILDSHNLKATFYVATGLGEDEEIKAGNSGDTFIAPEEIAVLDKAGHEIACHTYSHYCLDNGSADGLYTDANRNVSRLKSIIGENKAVKNFSWPFGCVNFRAKKLLAQQYETMRSSRPGLNRRIIDLSLLRATSIYHPSFDRDLLGRLVRQCELEKGWLIFYTHGVEADPDNYGCTPNEFDWVVNRCMDSKNEILTVREACRKILPAS